MVPIEIATLIVRAMLRAPHVMPSCVLAQVLVPGSLMTAVIIFALLPLATVLTAFAFGINTTMFVDICDNTVCLGSNNKYVFNCCHLCLKWHLSKRYG